MITKIIWLLKYLTCVTEALKNLATKVLKKNAQFQTKKIFGKTLTVN